MYERIKVNTLEGYDDVLKIYEVDKYGNVYGKNGVELKKSFNSSGYYQVALKVDGERRWRKSFIHRLVGLAFIGGKTLERNEIDHIDGNKLNNIYTNLRWVTRKENMGNPIVRERMWGSGGIRCYVYDYLLNFVGVYDSLSDAETAIGETIKAVNIRTRYHYILDKPDLSLVLKINRKQKIQSIVITDLETHEKFYFHSNREARRFFDGKVNITYAIQKNWTVRGRYKVRNLNYKKIIGMLDL